MKTNLNASNFRSPKDSLITRNKLRKDVLDVEIANDDEGFLINVVDVVAMVFFFLDLRLRKALE